MNSNQASKKQQINKKHNTQQQQYKKTSLDDEGFYRENDSPVKVNGCQNQKSKHPRRANTPRMSGR
jgi:hypothetical protein